MGAFVLEGGGYVLWGGYCGEQMENSGPHEMSTYNQN